MPRETRFAIRLFNVIAAFFAWSMFAILLSNMNGPTVVLSGVQSLKDYIPLLIVFTIALSATSAFAISFFRAGWAKALWRDAQFRLAWMLSVGMAHCLILFIRSWPSHPPEQSGAFVVSTLIIGVAFLSILCAFHTRRYLR